MSHQQKWHQAVWGKKPQLFIESTDWRESLLLLPFENPDSGLWSSPLHKNNSVQIFGHVSQLRVWCDQNSSGWAKEFCSLWKWKTFVRPWHCSFCIALKLFVSCCNLDFTCFFFFFCFFSLSGFCRWWTLAQEWCRWSTTFVLDPSISWLQHVGWLTLKRPACDETVQFVRNNKHCYSAANCGCGIF